MFFESILEGQDKYEACEKSGKTFNCFCGDEFYEKVEEYQLDPTNHEEFLNDLTNQRLCRVIFHQKKADLRLCNRLIKLHDIVAGFYFSIFPITVLITEHCYF